MANSNETKPQSSTISKWIGLGMLNFKFNRVPKSSQTKVYGNPFETNILIKCEKENIVKKSFFVHDLPPNCTVSELREQVSQKDIPFDDWDLVLKKQNTNPKSNASKSSYLVLNDKKPIGHYEIKCWDTVFVTPRSERQKSSGDLVTRFGEMSSYINGLLAKFSTSKSANSHYPYRAKFSISSSSLVSNLPPTSSAMVPVENNTKAA
ncbi:hypothetical protein GGI07_001531 [Coemansia sp. Benny D115]|nr:hypothetical protein GGI07_001531 [Coemansia sp. Benny D115]